MTARNDITGDIMPSRGVTDASRAGWEVIFGQKEVIAPPPPAPIAKSSLENDALRREWWQFCQENQRNGIPTFEEWIRNR